MHHTPPELLHAFWIAMGVVAKKEGDRDALSDGAEYLIDVAVEGKIDGRLVRKAIDGTLTVGHATERDASSAPPTDHLVAYLLGLIEAKKRAKLLRELPEKFQECQALPDVAEERVHEAENLLKRLRSRVRQTARGAVSFAWK